MGTYEHVRNRNLWTRTTGDPKIIPSWWQLKDFLFSPGSLGKWSNLRVAYFSNGLVQPPTRYCWWTKWSTKTTTWRRYDVDDNQESGEKKNHLMVFDGSLSHYLRRVFGRIPGGFLTRRIWFFFHQQYVLQRNYKRPIPSMGRTVYLPTLNGRFLLFSCREIYQSPSHGHGWVMGPRILEKFGAGHPWEQLICLQVSLPRDRGPFAGTGPTSHRELFL